MSLSILDAMSREGFEEILALHHRPSGLRAFLGIHDTSAGPAFGGIRRWTYVDEDQALTDCLRLSRAMTHKCALAGIRGGGGKLVLLDGPELDLAGAYAHIGRTVEHLGGRFYTGPDVGTGLRELGWVAEETGYVTRPGMGGPGDLPAATCAGVFAGIAASLRHLDGEEDWPRRSVVIQGIGGVGWLLAKRLIDQGARVIASDIDPERAEEARVELGVEVVEPSGEFEVECDVFSPCALGGILHDLSVKRLRARIVAGGANNVLARAVHGDQLERRGILYAPDFAINSGALIRGSSFHLDGRPAALDEIERRIGSVTAEILTLSSEEGLPPARVAVREAERRLAERRAARQALNPVPRTPIKSES